MQRRLVDRARIVLAAADGESSRTISVTRNVPRATALLWIRRYEAEGIAGIERDRPRSGRPRVMAADVEQAIVLKTITEKPSLEVATHWSTRLMAAATGQSREMIGRTWRKYARLAA